jgi:hypothetical protein
VDLFPNLNKQLPALARGNAQHSVRSSWALHRDKMEMSLRSHSRNWTKVLKASKIGQSADNLEIAYSAGMLADGAVDTTGQTLELRCLQQ